MLNDKLASLAFRLKEFHAGNKRIVYFTTLALLLLIIVLISGRSTSSLFSKDSSSSLFYSLMSSEKSAVSEDAPSISSSTSDAANNKEDASLNPKYNPAQQPEDSELVMAIWKLSKEEGNKKQHQQRSGDNNNSSVSSLRALTAGEFPTPCPDIASFVSTWLEKRKDSISRVSSPVKQKAMARKQWVVVDAGSADNGYFLQSILEVFGMKNRNSRTLGLALYQYSEYTAKKSKQLFAVEAPRRNLLCGSCCGCTKPLGVHLSANKKKERQQINRNVMLYSISPSPFHIDFMNRYFHDLLVPFASSTVNNDDKDKDNDVTPKPRRTSKPNSDDDNNNDETDQDKKDQETVATEAPPTPPPTKKKRTKNLIRTLMNKKLRQNPKSILKALALVREQTSEVPIAGDIITTDSSSADLSSPKSENNNNGNSDDGSGKDSSSTRLHLLENIAEYQLQTIFGHLSSSSSSSSSSRRIFCELTGDCSFNKNTDSSSTSSASSSSATTTVAPPSGLANFSVPIIGSLDQYIAESEIDILRTANPFASPVVVGADGQSPFATISDYLHILRNGAQKKFLESGKVGLYVFDLGGGERTSMKVCRSVDNITSTTGLLLEKYLSELEQWGYECYLPLTGSKGGNWQESPSRRMIPVNGKNSAWKSSYNYFHGKKFSVVCVNSEQNNHKNKNRFVDLQAAFKALLEQNEVLPVYNKCSFESIIKNFVKKNKSVRRISSGSWRWALQGASSDDSSSLSLTTDDKKQKKKQQSKNVARGDSEDDNSNPSPPATSAPETKKGGGSAATDGDDKDYRPPAAPRGKVRYAKERVQQQGQRAYKTETYKKKIGGVQEKKRVQVRQRVQVPSSSTRDAFNNVDFNNNNINNQETKKKTVKEDDADD